jgi:hypothetical protein
VGKSSGVTVLAVQSLMKLANKKGNEVGPEVVEEVEGDNVNVVSNTQLKVIFMAVGLDCLLLLSSSGLR